MARSGSRFCGASLRALRRARDTGDICIGSILANHKHGTLNVGVTNDIGRRVYEHRAGMVPGFTRRYGIKTLVHAEPYDRIDEARAMEARLKR